MTKIGSIDEGEGLIIRDDEQPRAILFASNVEGFPVERAEYQVDVSPLHHLVTNLAVGNYDVFLDGNLVISNVSTSEANTIEFVSNQVGVVSIVAVFPIAL